MLTAARLLAFNVSKNPDPSPATTGCQPSLGGCLLSIPSVLYTLLSIVHFTGRPCDGSHMRTGGLENFKLNINLERIQSESLLMAAVERC